jgi:hypothetical protein
MRSSQVNFFLTRTDQAELLRTIDRLNSFVYVEAVSQDGSPRILESPEVRKMGSERLKIFVARPEHASTIILRQSSKDAFVDVLRSPAVEFSRCYQDDHCIRRGRFYVVRSYFDERTVVKKDGEFLKWSEALISRTRRALTRDSKSFAYFGSQALRLKESGLKMELG